MTFYQSPNAANQDEDGASSEGTLLVERLRWMTLYESANAATPRNQIQRVVKRNGEFLGNSGALLATSVLTSLLGFAYWWVAARSFPARIVGSASAAVSAMTLISTLGMFGMGTLLISQLPKLKAGRGSLIVSCVMVSATVSAIGGVIYTVLATFGIPGLRGALGSPIGIGLLILATCLNAATLVFDEGLIGLMLGHLQLLRNAYFAVGKLVLLALLVFLPLRVTGSEVLATWVGGILLSLPLITFSLRRRGLGPIRPSLTPFEGPRPQRPRSQPAQHRTVPAADLAASDGHGRRLDRGERCVLHRLDGVVVPGDDPRQHRHHPVRRRQRGRGGAAGTCASAWRWLLVSGCRSPPASRSWRIRS